MGHWNDDTAVRKKTYATVSNLTRFRQRIAAENDERHPACVVRSRACFSERFHLYCLYVKSWKSPFETRPVKS